MRTYPAVRHHHIAASTVVDHVIIFVVTLVLSAAVTFLVGSAMLGRL